MQLNIDQLSLEQFNRGVKYLNNKRWDKALSLFKKAVRGAPLKEVWLNMGNAYAQQDCEDDALNCFLKAADHRTPHSDGTMGPYELAENNLGLLHFRNGRTREAIRHYERSIELGNGKNGDPIWNYANAYLKLCCSNLETDWDLAWKLYRHRFFRTNPTPIDSRIPEWDQVSKVSTIVVLSEQGQGDKIQFGRHLPQIRDWCDNLIVQVPDCMKPIYEPHGYHCVEDVTPWVETDARSVAFCDLHKIFGHSSTPAAWIDHNYYVPRVFGGTRPNIIVEWAGSTNHANDRHRSTTPEHFLKLGVYGNLYSFRSKAPRGITALDTQDDWKSSIEAILGSDLVVTVDTSIVHMCGALGHPCIMLQPRKETDWRWGEPSMGWNNVFYPSVMIARNPCNWTKTFEQVYKKVEEVLANHQQT